LKYRCIAGSLLFAWYLPHVRDLVRPIYRQIAILPEVAVGIDSASELRVPPGT
jgi:hypothetical protein